MSEYQDNDNKKVYNIDFDGTLTTGDSYVTLTPRMEVIHKVRNLYMSGHIIIIWSARWWSDANIIAGWCIMNEVPFHGLMLGKGGTNCYVDDKAVHIDDFIKEGD